MPLYTEKKVSEILGTIVGGSFAHFPNNYIPQLHEPDEHKVKEKLVKACVE